MCCIARRFLCGKRMSGSRIAGDAVDGCRCIGTTVWGIKLDSRQLSRKPRNLVHPRTSLAKNHHQSYTTHWVNKDHCFLLPVNLNTPDHARYLYLIQDHQLLWNESPYCEGWVARVQSWVLAETPLLLAKPQKTQPDEATAPLDLSHPPHVCQ